MMVYNYVPPSKVRIGGREGEGWWGWGEGVWKHIWFMSVLTTLMSVPIYVSLVVEEELKFTTQPFIITLPLSCYD